MRHIIYLIIVILAFSACQGSSESRGKADGDLAPVIQIAPENLVSISFDVEGMTCPGCEGSVVSSLKNIDGVAEAEASHLEGKTTIKFDKTLVTETAMEEAIVSRGYRVTGQTNIE